MPRPRTAALALCTLASLAAASSLDSPPSSNEPRVGFLQDVLSSRTAGQNYCKVRLLPPSPPSSTFFPPSERADIILCARAQPTGQIHDACCDYETVESVNEDLFGRLHALVAEPYFRYHKVRPRT